MSHYHPDCLGKYNFDHIAQFARQRFVDGSNTIDMLMNAKSQREKEEIVLVASMSLDDDTVNDLHLSCKHAENCQVTTCRKVIKKLIDTAKSP